MMPNTCVQSEVAPQSGIGMRFDYAMHDDCAVVGIEYHTRPPRVNAAQKPTLPGALL